MEKSFISLQEKENGDYRKTESKWWNGHAYLPLVNHHLNYTYLNSKITIHYEFRQSEFSKPSMIDGGAFGDRHNCTFKCELFTQNLNPPFSISERSLFTKLLKIKSNPPFKIKCNHHKMIHFLQTNPTLNDIFKIVENSPEFSPLIESTMFNQQYELNVMYNTQQKDEKLMLLINEFCKNLIEFLQN